MAYLFGLTRHWLRFAIVTWLAVFMTTAHASGQKTNTSQKTLLIVGDSISAAYGIDSKLGWVSLLSEKMSKTHANYRIVNASISGDTTAGGAQRLPDLIKKHQPSIVVIELGGNDALRALPLSQTENNFKTMIVAAKNAKSKVLLIPMQIPPNYGPTYTQGFNGLYAKLGKTQKVGVSAFIFKDFAQDLTAFQADRIHPNVGAQVKMLDTVWPSIQTLLK